MNMFKLATKNVTCHQVNDILGRLRSIIFYTKCIKIITDFIFKNIWLICLKN